MEFFLHIIICLEVGPDRPGPKAFSGFETNPDPRTLQVRDGSTGMVPGLETLSLRIPGLVHIVILVFVFTILYHPGI